MVSEETQFETDVIETSGGDLEITFLGHGTLMFMFGGEVIHVDPYSKVADYAQLPKADLILITHGHGDHLDAYALAHIRTEETDVVVSPGGAGQIQDAAVMRNGDVREVRGLSIEAVPAYNIVHKRDNGQPYHPKGEGNGYVITFGDKRVYIAGDTENIPEMKDLEDIHIAFLPMNLPYSMTPEMVADAAQMFEPQILYPYHYGDTDTAKLVKLLRGGEDIKVRIRDMA